MLSMVLTFSPGAFPDFIVHVFDRVFAYLCRISDDQSYSIQGHTVFPG